MAIKFNVHETPQPKSRKQEALTHARAIANSTKKMDDICAIICARSSISSADVKAVLDSFVWMIGFSMQYGDHVELEDLGHFSPSLRTRKTADGKYSITVDGVNFRCSEKLKNQLKAVHLEKEKSPTVYSQDERKERMISYLTQHENITTPLYAKLNGCSHYKASSDLKQFTEEGWLHRIGSRTHITYLLTENILEEK